MKRTTTIKFGIAAVIAGAVAGGIGVGHAQVVNSDVVATTTTVDAGTNATAQVVTPQQTG